MWITVWATPDTTQTVLSLELFVVKINLAAAIMMEDVGVFNFHTDRFSSGRGPITKVYFANSSFLVSGTTEELLARSA